MIEKFYDIDKIKTVFYRQQIPCDLVDGYYDNVGYIKQFVYVEKGSIIDIFGDKYLAGLYVDGQMPEFYYNPVNYLETRYFNADELKSGKVSEIRLLEIYCQCNSKYLTFEDALRQDKFRGSGDIIDISRFKMIKKSFENRKARKKV